MKKLSLLIVLFCASLTIMAQDVIVKKDGTTIESKVIEINGTEIKYKKWSNQDGPLYSINRSAVDSINYQNGEVELITSGTDVPQSSGILERRGRNLTLNGKKIYGEEVRLLVGEQNYQTYLSARKQIGAGNFFWLCILGVVRSNGRILSCWKLQCGNCFGCGSRCQFTITDHIQKHR